MVMPGQVAKFSKAMRTRKTTNSLGSSTRSKEAEQWPNRTKEDYESSSREESGRSGNPPPRDSLDRHLYASSLYSMPRVARILMTARAT